MMTPSSRNMSLLAVIDIYGYILTGIL